MTNDEYKSAVDICRAMGTMSNSVDWGSALLAADRAATLGAILDPTLYRDAMPTHSLIVRGLRAAQKFALEMAAIEKEFRKTKQSPAVQKAMDHLHDHLEKHLLVSDPSICPACGGSRVHTRLRGYRCQRCD